MVNYFFHFFLNLLIIHPLSYYCDFIFKDRFFFDKTQSSIAKELGISQMTVSRLEKKVVEKLKKEYEKNL